MHKIRSQLVIHTEKATQSILTKRPCRRNEQTKTLSGKKIIDRCMEHPRSHCSELIRLRWEKNTCFLAGSLFRQDLKDLLHLPWQSCSLAACRASAFTQLQETSPSFCNFFCCLQAVQSDLAGLINHTSMTPSSEMFYCSNEARALRRGSYHYVHLAAKEMEAEM